MLSVLTRLQKMKACTTWRSDSVYTFSDRAVAESIQTAVFGQPAEQKQTLSSLWLLHVSVHLYICCCFSGFWISSSWGVNIPVWKCLQNHHVPSMYELEAVHQRAEEHVWRMSFSTAVKPDEYWQSTGTEGWMSTNLALHIHDITLEMAIRSKAWKVICSFFKSASRWM